MREERMMSREQDLVKAQLHTRSVFAGRMPQIQKALRLVQRDPMRDAIGNPVHDRFDIMSREPLPFSFHAPSI